MKLFFFVGADVNLRDYSGKKPINYLKEPESDDPVINEQIPVWQRHFYTGMNLTPTLSDDVYDRVEGKMVTSKLDNEVVKRRQSEKSVSVPFNDRRQRSKSAVIGADRKSSLSDSSSKSAKTSRKESSRGLWKMPSIRKQKPPSVSSIEHPVSIATPNALSHIASGVAWKPAGPQT